MFSDSDDDRLFLRDVSLFLCTKFAAVWPLNLRDDLSDMLEHVYSNVKSMNTEYVNTRMVKAASFLPDATPYIATEDVMHWWQMILPISGERSALGVDVVTRWIPAQTICISEVF